MEYENAMQEQQTIKISVDNHLRKNIRQQRAATVLLAFTSSKHEHVRGAVPSACQINTFQTRNLNIRTAYSASCRLKE